MYTVQHRLVSAWPADGTSMSWPCASTLSIQQRELRQSRRTAMVCRPSRNGRQRWLRPGGEAAPARQASDRPCSCLCRPPAAASRESNTQIASPPDGDMVGNWTLPTVECTSAPSPCWHPPCRYTKLGPQDPSFSVISSTVGLRITWTCEPGGAPLLIRLGDGGRAPAPSTRRTGCLAR